MGTFQNPFLQQLYEDIEIHKQQTFVFIFLILFCENAAVFLSCNSPLSYAVFLH